MYDVFCRHTFRLDTIELFQLLIRPGPFVGIVVAVHLLKLGIDRLQAIDFAGLNTVYQRIYLTLWGYQSGNIHPFAAANGSIGLQTGTYFFIAPEVNAFQALDDRVSEDLMNGYFIEADTFHQSRVTYLRAMERVDVRQLATGMTQILQRFPSLEHFLHRVGAEKIIVDVIQFVRVGTPVTFRPLLGITDGTHTTQVDTGYKVGGIILLYQVRERQVRSIRMVDMAPHYQGKRSHPCRPQDVRIGSRLGTTLQSALMDRP